MQSKLTQRGNFASVFSRVEEGIKERAEAVGREAQTEIEEANHDFFSIMAAKIVGVSQVPNLDGVSVPRWKPLNPQYLRRKEKRRSPGFYKFTGNMNTVLRRMNGTTFLGRVSMQIGNRSSLAPFSAEGVTSLRKGYRITLRLTGLNDVSAGHPEENLNSQMLAYKLTNFRGRRQRTILGPYLRWWTTRYLRYIVNRIT